MVSGGSASRWWSRAVGLAVAGTARLARLTGPHAAVLLLVLAVGGVVVALTATAAEIYEAVVEEDGIALVDQPVLEAMLAARSEPLTRAAQLWSDIGGPVVMPVLAAGAAALLAVLWRRWTPVLVVAVAGAGSLAMTLVGKPLLGRARPEQADAVPPFESSAAFPSGHALNSAVIAGAVAYLLVRRQRRTWARVATVGAAVAFTFTMGLSRVYLGHHWFTDVLVAWTLGLAWLVVVVAAHQLYRRVLRRGDGPRVAPWLSAPCGRPGGDAEDAERRGRG